MTMTMTMTMTDPDRGSHGVEAGLRARLCSLMTRAGGAEVAVTPWG
jgi:hypothetical protein